MANNSEFSVSHAEAADIPSLSTIFPRSFHPVNPFHRTSTPDTPLVRQWWSNTFLTEIRDPICHVLKATQHTSPDHVLGVLVMRLSSDGTSSFGLWTERPLTADHDTAAWRGLGESMMVFREKHTIGKQLYNIELFGVDHDFAQRGLGRMLLDKACEIADTERIQMCVEANATSMPFYRRWGFEVVDMLVLPGELQYKEYFLIRNVSSK